MNHVWLFFKIIELISGLIALAFHIAGSLHFDEPLPHKLIFCGTFGGYVIICIISIWKISNDYRTFLYPEMLICSTSILMHFICGLLSMYYAEIDFHIMYMGPEQELAHVFFHYCRSQSIASICCASAYLLQFVLVLDFLLKMVPNDDYKELSKSLDTVSIMRVSNSLNKSIGERDYIARTEANVYFFGPQVDYFLQQHFKFFRRLARSQEITMKAQKWQQAVLSKDNSSSSTSVTINEIVTSFKQSPSDLDNDGLYAQDSNESTIKPNSGL